MAGVHARRGADPGAGRNLLSLCRSRTLEGVWRDRNRRIHISADEARGAEINITSPARFWLFVGGLIAAVVIAVAIAMASV